MRYGFGRVARHARGADVLRVFGRVASFETSQAPFQTSLPPFQTPHPPGPEQVLIPIRTTSVATPLCPYGIAHRRVYALSFRWTLPFSLWYGLGCLEGGICTRIVSMDRLHVTSWYKYFDL
jgi:hypothetical protein